MQICADHWARMREAVQARGMWHLVHQSGEAAHAVMVAELQGTKDEKRDFDPLLNANWVICGQYLKDVGLAGMVGDKCPLCEVEKSQEGRAQNWIDGAIDDQLGYARHIGLMPQPS